MSHLKFLLFGQRFLTGLLTNGLVALTFTLGARLHFPFLSIGICDIVVDTTAFFLSTEPTHTVSAMEDWNSRSVNKKKLKLSNIIICSAPNTPKTQLQKH